MLESKLWLTAHREAHCWQYHAVSVPYSQHGIACNVLHDMLPCAAEAHGVLPEHMAAQIQCTLRSTVSQAGYSVGGCGQPSRQLKGVNVSLVGECCRELLEGSWQS